MHMSKLVFTGQAVPTGRAATLYDVHRQLWRVFGDGPERERDFVYREMEPGSFLVVSARPPAPDRNLWASHVKVYDPRVSAGERLHFSLRANPVRKTRDGQGRQVRHDVVQDAFKRLEDEGMTRADVPGRFSLAQESVASWLQARAGRMGIDLEEDGLVVEAYDRHSFRKPKGGKPVVVSVVDVRGFCTVADPDALRAALFGGVGPAKAFGCGLLLVRRA